MSRHDDRVSLLQMRSHAQEAVAMGRGKTQDDIAADRKLQLALTRLIEIVGEAAARVSPETRLRHPEIPWPAMVGMRNRLIHGYDMVDWAVLQSTISVDLPQLVSALDAILGP
jgi:uncharacterized protein with HEPN domain